MHMYIMPTVPRIRIIIDMDISVKENTSSSMAIAALIFNELFLLLYCLLDSPTIFSYLVHLLFYLNWCMYAIGISVR